MKDRSIHLADLKTTGPHVLEVKAYYNEGGPNYFHGGMIRRGYYLSITPVRRETSPSGFSSRISEPFGKMGGLKLLLAEAKAYNAKSLARLSDRALAHPEYANMLAQILERSGLTLEAAPLAMAV